DGLPGGEDDGPASSRREGGEAHLHRREPRHEGEHGRPENGGALEAGLPGVAEIAVIGPGAERLRMRGICKRFGPTAALTDVDLTVSAGEVHALVGENGSGKSTLMKVLSGAIPADSGSIYLDGRPYRPRGPVEARRAGVAMIYQELSLAPHLSVEA